MNQSRHGPQSGRSAFERERESRRRERRRSTMTSNERAEKRPADAAAQRICFFCSELESSAHGASEAMRCFGARGVGWRRSSFADDLPGDHKAPLIGRRRRPFGALSLRRASVHLALARTRQREREQQTAGSESAPVKGRRKKSEKERKRTPTLRKREIKNEEGLVENVTEKLFLFSRPRPSLPLHSLSSLLFSTPNTQRKNTLSFPVLLSHHTADKNKNT